MHKYENWAYNNKFKVVAGVDEVGRGSIAGPLVVAMIILPKNYKNKQVNDSKKLNPKIREILYKQLLNDAIDYQIEIIKPDVVDKLNPKQASILGMEMCYQNIKTKPDIVLIDYEKIRIDAKTISIVDGDQKSISIAAASIIAKVYRDNLMKNLSLKYPNYNLECNKGYLTKDHILAIEKFGPIKKLHRYSYKPIKGNYK